MGNFEKLSVLVIVVIIVMILVVAIATWTGDPSDAQVSEGANGAAGPGLANPGGEAGARDREGPPAPRPGADPGRINWDELIDGIKKDPAAEPAPRAGVKPDQPPAQPAQPPATPPAPAPEAAGDTANWEYVVKSGDTIGGIAERELGTVRRQGEIMALNPGVDPRALQLNQALVMPPRTLARGPASASGAGSAPPATPAAAGGAPKPGDWYVVQRGDRLSTLSKRVYRTSERWPDIWASNLALIRNPDEPPPGARIFLPR